MSIGGHNRRCTCRRGPSFGSRGSTSGTCRRCGTGACGCGGPSCWQGSACTSANASALWRRWGSSHEKRETKRTNRKSFSAAKLNNGWSSSFLKEGSPCDNAANTLKLLVIVIKFVQQLVYIKWRKNSWHDKEKELVKYIFCLYRRSLPTCSCSLFYSPGSGFTYRRSDTGDCRHTNGAPGAHEQDAEENCGATQRSSKHHRHVDHLQWMWHEVLLPLSFLIWSYCTSISMDINLSLRWLTSRSPWSLRLAT